MSDFYTENTTQGRRNLRTQIEKRSLEINDNFLAAFEQVKESFDKVYANISDMNESVQEMTSRLQNTKAQTKHLLEQTSAFQEDK